MVMRPRLAIAPAALCGLAVALILLAMPVGLVETLVASSGLSEALPAAAPPLGLKARLLLAAFGALMAAGVAWAGRDQGRVPAQEQKDGRRQGVAGVKIMGFALPKLNWLARGRGAGESRGSRPALRRADAHPDAPARAPIFASRDFGGLDIFPRVTGARPVEIEAAETEQSSVILALPCMPAEQAMEAEFEEIDEPHIAVADAQPSIPVEAAQVQPLSITALTERLERGLARRARAPRPGASPVLADMPVEQQIPVRDRVEDDTDQALRAALSTLRALADRTR